MTEYCLFKLFSRNLRLTPYCCWPFLSLIKVFTGKWCVNLLVVSVARWFDAAYARVQQAIGDREIEQWWFNCGAPGDEYRWHSHSPCKWAAVLYIQMPENAGAIEFKGEADFQTILPRAGDSLLFPGDLAHRVHKNLSNKHRISAAFNLM
jgi:hypothetical protein